MGELDDAVDDQPDQDRDQYAPPDQCEGFPPPGGGFGFWLLAVPVPALVIAVAVIAIDGWVVGAVVRRVVPCHGR